MVLHDHDLSGGDEGCIIRGPRAKRRAGGDKIQAVFSLDRDPIDDKEVQSVYLLKLGGAKVPADTGAADDGYPLRVAVNDSTVYDGLVPLSPASGARKMGSGNDTFFVPTGVFRKGSNVLTIESRDTGTDPDHYCAAASVYCAFGSTGIPVGTPARPARKPVAAILYEGQQRDLEIEYVPRTVRIGETFSVWLRTLRPHEGIAVKCHPSISPLGALPRSLDSAGLHEFEFTATEPLAKAEITFLSGDKTAVGTVGHITSLSGDHSPFTGLTPTVLYCRDQMLHNLTIMSRLEICNFLFFWDYFLPGWIKPASKEDWVSWAEFCRRKKWYFINNDNSAKQRWKSADIVAAMNKVAGSLSLGGEVNEPGGWFASDRRGAHYHYRFGGYSRGTDKEGRAELQKQLPGLQSCRDHYIRNLGKWVRSERDKGYSQVVSVNSSPTMTYDCDAGAVPAPEIFPRQANWLMSLARGCARAHGTPWYYHIAIMCQTLVPHDSPDKYRLWDMTLSASYIYGAFGIWNENGLWRTEHWWGDPVGNMTATYRGIQKKFYDFIRTHERRGTPHVSLAVIHGNLDGSGSAPVTMVARFEVLPSVQLVEEVMVVPHASVRAAYADPINLDQGLVIGDLWNIHINHLEVAVPLELSGLHHSFHCLPFRGSERQAFSEWGPLSESAHSQEHDFSGFIGLPGSVDDSHYLSCFLKLDGRLRSLSNHVINVAIEGIPSAFQERDLPGSEFPLVSSDTHRYTFVVEAFFAVYTEHAKERPFRTEDEPSRHKGYSR